MGNPILRQVARDLSIEEIQSEEIKSLIADMFETMQEANGIGLAAPQIGILEKLFVVELYFTVIPPPTLPAVSSI